jgi:hypothetical protein
MIRARKNIKHFREGNPQCCSRIEQCAKKIPAAAGRILEISDESSAK